jgi:hypothetical protein
MPITNSTLTGVEKNLEIYALGIEFQKLYFTGPGIPFEMSV